MEHDSDARLLAELKILSAMEQEWARERARTSTKSQELQHPDESKVAALMNKSSNEIYSTSTLSHQVSEPHLQDQSLRDFIHDINSLDDSQHTQYVREREPLQSPTVDEGSYISSQSVPVISSNTSQVQLQENRTRHSETNQVYWKTPSLRSEPPTASKQPIQQYASSQDLGFSEPNATLGRDAIMGKSSAIPDLSNMDENFESSHSHAQHSSSVFGISMLYDQWQRISQARSRISELRGTLRIMRMKLRTLRDDKSLADDAYMKEINMRELQMPFPSSWWPKRTLDELIFDCQKVRDEYGPLEDEYNNLERDLSSQEYHLSNQEEHFYAQLQDPSRFFPASIDPERGGNPPEEPEQIKPYKPHPLVDEYLSKSGQLDRFRELYDDILDEKMNLEDQLTLRKRFDMTLLPENQEWLDSSQSQLDDLTSKIQVAEIVERELRENCLSLGLIDELGDPIEHSSLNHPGSTFTTYSERCDSPRKYVPVSSPSPPEKIDTVTDQEILDSDHNDLARNERFDRWSLEKLQISLVEVNTYANCFKNCDEVRDLNTIQQEVCKDNFINDWFNDGFTNNAPRSAGWTSCQSTSQYMPHTNTSAVQFPTSDIVFSDGSLL